MSAQVTDRDLEIAARLLEIAHLRTLLARVLFMDYGSAEDALDYLGGMIVAMDLCDAHSEGGP